MSKLSFRARALDAGKPLPVFRCEDLPDLHEYASINRAVPQMPTGMEKEEESEHHLQRAISAQQVYGEKRDNMVIPVPEAERNITHYESLYPGEFKMPKQLIHIQPFSLDTEQPDYDLDSEDETFVNKLKKKMEITALQFEEMIDRLEKGSGQQLVSLQEAKLLLKDDDELIKEVFDYWSRKRKTCKGGSLIPNVKQEKRDGSSTSDPYVAFRRRTEKMQTRKNRKNDEASYEKMLKLRRDLSRAVTILEMIKRREKSKRELLHLTLEIVEKRNGMPDFGSEVMAEALAQRALVKPVYTIPIIPPSSSNQYRHQDHLDMKDYKKPEKTEAVRTKRKYEKKPKIPPLSTPQHSGPSVFNPKDLNQYDFPSSDEEPFSQIHSGSSEAEEENDPDGCYAFRRKAGCQYYASRPDQCGNWPWVSPSEGGLGDPRFRYCLTSLNMPRRCIGLARRRVGRGARILLDRAHTDLDAICQSLDSDPEPEPLASPLPSSPLRNSNGSTSEKTNTSDPTSSPRPPSSSSPLSSSSSSSSPTPMDLSQILLNIKSCRWRHFRPRTLSHHPLGGGDLSRRGFRDLSRTLSGLTRTLSGGASSQNRTGPAPTPVHVVTAEQYQQHQEQLALMRKQQLEQSQQQQQANNPATTTNTNAQALASKTLDQASAQFAASALVTTDQLLAFKSKEELVLASGVNGVLAGAGVFKGLHLSSTTSTLHQTNQSTHTTSSSAAPTFLQPSSNSATPSPANAVPTSLTSTPSGHAATAAAALGILGCSAAAAPTATTQVLIGNNICLSVPSAAGLAGRHIPRTLGNVPPSALKLSASTNLQMPKVSGASSMDSRDNHDEDKPALNSIADNTVAMEVT
ncbi:LOW QUALITY PROTEIN: enhancer of polycomb homolog 1-like [Anoplopoma fimbria]|uniref:LOW QUALITY PROTEIN: enhancer of polycomb homolog 1-like n=1 Tax=Anoplopoma fimbria TaxID=229290 RepID=UPI0023EDF84D|nr:LOW QUALITY PROTEIN: enhancer of polycomb homolog 1-like [Anoplopoma fimbria]